MKILAVYKKSKYELYNNSPDKSIKEWVNSDDIDAVNARRSHEIQKRSLDKIVDELDKTKFPYDIIYRANLKETSGYSLIVSIGGDGTFLDISHFVKDTPLLGVNSDPGPKGSKGFYCSANVHDFKYYLQDIKFQIKLNRLELLLDNNPIQEQVLNDVFIGHLNPAATTRYRFEVDSKVEDYKNSGLLVCTSSGSGAWMYQEGGILMSLDSDKMQYLHRGTRFANPNYADNILVKSLTRESKMYIDGEHLTYNFPVPSNLEIRKGLPLNVVGKLQR